jgi:hypothetical protein
MAAVDADAANATTTPKPAAATHEFRNFIRDPGRDEL